MLLQQKSTGKLVEVVDIYELANPFDKELVGCLQWDEEVPDPQCFEKSDLCFTSGENLPQCWTDENFGEERLMDNLDIDSAFDGEFSEHNSKSRRKAELLSNLI